MPYAIASIAEMEAAFQIIADVGVGNFMRQKTSVEHRDSAMSAFFRANYHVQLAKTRGQLFPEAWRAFLPSSISTP